MAIVSRFTEQQAANKADGRAAAWMRHRSDTRSVRAWTASRAASSDEAIADGVLL